VTKVIFSPPSVRSFLVAAIERKIEERENVRNWSRPTQSMRILNKIIIEKRHKLLKDVAVITESSMVITFFCVEGRQLLRVLEQLSTDLIF
jgi:hypothetical protein